MGDRGNIVVHYPNNQRIYFYTHSSGSDLPAIVAAALERGRTRWDDEQYLPRVLFSELIYDDIDGTTGYGISPERGDGGTEVHVDLNLQTVCLEDDEPVPFQRWIELYS